jgi:tRNA pseudouridine55 synthase
MVRGVVQVASGGQLIAIAEVERGEIIPRRVFNLAGIAGRAGRDKGW